MAKAKFIFTALHNSFKVKVPNLESLSVTQIQEIEAFVKQRKGIFDFASYSFSIQKRLDFKSFQELVTLSGIDALFEEEALKVKKRERIGFGQYKGMFYDELPDSYLLWLLGNYHGPDKKHIEQELKKRGK